MNSGQILKYYSNKAVQAELLKIARDRECIGRFEDGGYMKRPDTLQYPNDIIDRVKKGAVSFHCSVERWHQPMQLSLQMNQKQINDLRIGWDLVIDIDSKSKLEYSKIAAEEVCNFLKEKGISPNIKFSGRRGFHISVAGNAFPQNIDFKPVSSQYPEFPQTIGTYIKEKVKEKILEKLVSAEGGVAALMKNAETNEVSPYAFVDIENNWGSRHLFRTPYSLHEKTWLVSVPIKLFKLKSFSPDSAKPENIKTILPFFDNKDLEAQQLMIEALEWNSKLKPPVEEKPIRKFKIKDPVPEEFFPPCILAILGGLKDGRKRSIFTLGAFLKSVNWDYKTIEERLIKWNENNMPPLSSRAIRTQLKWHERQNRDLLPPNCESDMFYKSIGVCKKDPKCEGLKNPVNYALRGFGKKIKIPNKK